MCRELIPLMAGEEVVDHILDRGSTRNLLPERASQPALNWIFSATLFSFAPKFSRKACNFCECYPCPAVEVIVTLSLTEKPGQEADNSSLLTHASVEPVMHRNYSNSHNWTKLFPGSMIVRYIALFHILIWYGSLKQFNWVVWMFLLGTVQYGSAALNMLWLHPALSLPAWGCFLFCLLSLGEKTSQL